MSTPPPGEGTAPLFGDHTLRLEALERKGSTAFSNRRRPKPSPIVPSVAITHSANQSIAENTETVLSLDTTDYQTFAGMHVGSTIEAVEKGIYAVWAAIKWQEDTTEGFRSLHLETTGGVVLQDVHHVIPGTLNSRASSQEISWQGKLAKGTRLRLSVIQISGAALSVMRGVQFSPYLGMTWLSRY